MVNKTGIWLENTLRRCLEIVEFGDFQYFTKLFFEEMEIIGLLEGNVLVSTVRRIGNKFRKILQTTEFPSETILVMVIYLIFRLYLMLLLYNLLNIIDDLILTTCLDTVILYVILIFISAEAKADSFG